MKKIFLQTNIWPRVLSFGFGVMSRWFAITRDGSRKDKAMLVILPSHTYCTSGGKHCFVR